MAGSGPGDTIVRLFPRRQLVLTLLLENAVESNGVVQTVGRGPMSIIPFLLALIFMGVVIFWYVQDEATRSGKGKSGLLGMGDRGADHKPGTPDWKPHGTRPWRVGGK